MKKPNRSGKSRVIILLVLCALVFGLFLARLIWMQFVQADYYAQKVAQASTTRYSYTVPAARGDIVDRNGEVLAQDTPVWDVSVKYPAPPGTTVQEVANRTLQLLQMTGGEDVETQLAAFCSAVSAGEFPLVSGLTAAQTAVLYDAGLVQSGAVRLTPSGVRSWPDGTLLPHALGTVGPITAEQWRVEDEDGNVSYPLRDAGYNMNDLIGQSGLEKVYEDQLRGTDGTTEIVVGDGEIQEIRTGVEPTPGKTVMLTINREFQKRVDEALERNILTLQQTRAENSGKECNAGAVVVVDVNTGGLLAVSNYPSYDLNLYRSNYSDYASDAALPLLNRAFTGQYAPGSAYKPSVAMTGLLNGIVTPDDIIECNGTYTYYAPSYTPRCQHYHPGNQVDLYTALQHSCNVYFYDVGRRAGLAACADMANRLGLGVATGVEVGEALGHLTSTEDENYTVGLDVQSAIGQGNNAFTPVQLATYAATIANGGTRYKTHLVSGLVDTNTGEVVESVEPVVEDQIEDTIGAFDAVKEGMVLMAQGNSTLRNYPLTIAAKTGSPQRSEVYKVINGTRYYYCNGVMIAFCPAEDPEIAVGIVLEYGGSGSNAAQLMVDVFNAYYFDRSSSFEPDPEGELLS